MTIDQLMQSARTHHTAGRVREAEALYRQVLAQQPDHAEALHLLGMVAFRCGQAGDALRLMERSVALAPNSAHFLTNLAEVTRGVGQFDRATELYERALALRPNDPEGLHGLGIAHDKAGRVEAAAAAFRRAMAVAPQFAKPYMSLGALVEKQGHYAEALALFERAIALKPDYALAHTSRAHALLRFGRYEEGWREYEWRWRVDNFPGRRPDPRRPLWDGSPLAGRTLLLYTEQGLGDAIQFARYAPFAAARAGNGRVVVSCQNSLARLFRQMPGVADVLPERPDASAYDVQLPLMSLPHLFGTTLDTIPHDVPYLKAPPAVTEAWRARVASDGVTGRRIGLCWMGGRSTPGRSLALDQLAALAQVPGVTFYSLQLGPAAAEAGRPPSGMRLIDLTSHITDFADTAALIEHLDGVVSIDTAVAHLAGALGKPTWTLLKFMNDWRWLLDRNDSPWYPAMRLYRQRTAGDWAPVVQEIVEDLRRP